jgi:hypothetical protein
VSSSGAGTASPSSGGTTSGALGAAGPSGSGAEDASWIAAPPTNAAFDAARALVESDSKRLGLLGPPLSPARERAIISRHWR